MFRHIQIFFCIALIMTLVVAKAQAANSLPHKTLTIIQPQGDESKKPSPIRFELQEAENGLQALLHFTESTEKKDYPLPPDGVAGGDYQIFLDEMIVIHEPYKGPPLDVTRDIPLTTLQNGKHSLRCELRGPSGEIYKNEILFVFDGSPVLTVTGGTVDRAGLLDPFVQIDFLGVNNGDAGFMDVYVDERPLINVPVKKDATGKEIPLSQIIGKPISTVSLVQGTHLLTLKAISISGNAVNSYTSFTVNSAPELEIIRDQSNKFLKATAAFLPANEGYAGSVEVFYEHNIILSKRGKDASITITRDEIVEGLKKNKLQHRETSVAFVFSLRAANSTETWQVVTIHP
jgi:hypothetical protein